MNSSTLKRIKGGVGRAFAPTFHEIQLTLRRNMTANVPLKILFKVSNNMVSGDDSAKKGTQVPLTEES